MLQSIRHMFLILLLIKQRMRKLRMTVNLSFFNSTDFLFCLSDEQLGFHWEDRTLLQRASPFSDVFTARNIQYFPGKFQEIFWDFSNNSYRKFPFIEFLFYFWYKGKKTFSIRMQLVTVSYFFSLTAFFCFVFKDLLCAAPPLTSLL